jgi:transcriptional repressor NrdR
VKRNQKREKFTPEKVTVNVLKTGAPLEITREIGGIIDEKVTEGTRTEAIRDMVLGELDKRNPAWADNWRVYDRAVKKREA